MIIKNFRVKGGPSGHRSCQIGRENVNNHRTATTDIVPQGSNCGNQDRAQQPQEQDNQHALCSQNGVARGGQAKDGRPQDVN